MVQSQQPRERREAFSAALEQVLQKLSGVASLEQYEGVEAALSSAADLVVSFHYSDYRKPMADGSRQSELRLVVQFSDSAVDRLRVDLGLPFWEPGRKPVTIWVVVDTGVSRQVMPLEFEYIRASMTDAAMRRGLPVRWPQPDEFGEYGVDIQLLWGGYIEDIADLDNESVLLATARREGPMWNVRVNLAEGDRLWNWRSRSLELEQALVTGVHQAAEEIAAANSIVATDQGNWNHEISVRGITGEKDFVRCLNYLMGVSVVDRVDIRGAVQGRVDFLLRLNALPSYFERSLKAGGVLELRPGEQHYSLNRALPDDY